MIGHNIDKDVMRLQGEARIWQRPDMPENKIVD
jgi:hypothetical protein